MLAAVEVALDGAELQAGGMLVLWGEAKLMSYVCLGGTPQHAA